MRMDVQRHDADIGDVTIHYLTAGTGEPLVLLHGIPQTSHEWRHVIPLLADRYSIIAPDLRGLGDSSRPRDGYDKKTVAQDVWGLVHGHLGIDRFFLAGHDWGGPTAFALTMQHRDAVRRLAILDVAIPGGGDFSQGGRRWHHAFFRTRDLPEALTVGREETLLEWFFENYGFRANCIPDEDRREYYRTYKKLGALRAMFEYYRALPTDAADNQAMLARDGKLTMPVLALGGDKSFGRGLETLESVRHFATDVRGGLIPNSGHWVAEEAPEFIAQAFREFFVDDDRAPR
jgi:pimeloyl-ACP methyl ester carboxylesterase